MEIFSDPRLPFTMQLPDGCEIKSATNPITKEPGIIVTRKGTHFFNLTWGKYPERMGHSPPPGWKLIEKYQIPTDSSSIILVVARSESGPFVKYAFIFGGQEFVFTGYWRQRAEVEKYIQSVKFRSEGETNKVKPVEFTNKAFYLVELGNYDSAIDLLKQAILIDPLCGDAYNELAFIYGEKKGNLDVAEEYALKAVECDPNNPKFHNAVNHNQLARAKRLKTRREIREIMIKIRQEIQRNIDNYSSYPPAYLIKAIALALDGEPKHIWENELRRAEELYLQAGIIGAGLPFNADLLKNIITSKYNQCLEMNAYWNNIPEG